VKTINDDEIRRRVGASYASVARNLKVSKMTICRALEAVQKTAELPEELSAITVAASGHRQL
jgi:DNA invertase Pin-like site-specific DNA recombinase